jgi:hypothetical protein
MTLPFAAFKTAIAAWVEAQSGTTFQWRDESGGWQSKTRIRGHLSNSDVLGEDFLTWAQDTDLDVGSDFVPTVSGNRTLRLSLYCHSRDQRGNNTASYYLEKIRASIKKPSVRAGLYAAGLVITSTEPVQDIALTIDDRVESRASLDIALAAVVNVRDEAEADSYVDNTVISADLETPAGETKGWTEETFE